MHTARIGCTHDWGFCYHYFSAIHYVGNRPDSEVYAELQALWLLATNDYIALNQC